MTLSLLIIGAGRLGALVGKKAKAAVTAETLTTRQHESLRAAGMTPRLRSAEGSFDSVVMTVPPSQTENYTAEAMRAVALWNQRGNLILVSSTAVYAENRGGKVNETSPLATSERARVLIEAENVVLAAGGSVVRLAGLYDDVSGPQISYKQKTASPLNGEALINLIHRDDAADLVVAALHRKIAGLVYLGCEDRAVTRQELGPACRFAGTDGGLGKRCDGTWTRRNLNWTPKRQLMTVG